MPQSSARARRLAAPIIAAAVLAASLTTGVGPAQSAPASTGTGDSLFPDVGTSAYDVKHYDIDLAYAADGSIRARTTIQARADHRLSSFDLDLVGLTVDRVRVDGRPAEASRTGEKLTVTPAHPIMGSFRTVVDYHGTPQTYTDPDGSSEGWVPTSDGATVLAEPIGAMTWFPDNNTPRDKATFDIALTVPRGLEAASNGVLESRRHRAGTTTWSWSQDRPMAPYLAMISIGQYQVFTSSMELKSGRRLPIVSFVDPSFGPLAHQRQLLKDAIRYGERIYGRYPGSSAGIVVEDVGVGYALETQDRAVYDGAPDDLTVVHETAHQWVGNSVGLTDWGDIWLNEGFATHAEWSWTAATGGTTLGESFAEAYASHPADDPFWDLPPADLGDPANLFAEPTYARGAMTLDALRQRIGGRDFAELRRTWTTRHRGGNVTTRDLVRLAERISGEDLDAFFQAWLLTPERPAL
ncbi:MAG: pepN 2 [Aeromicrobium sp.]|uniref:M1 family metallopeptidase n=1 Tax=Aeromicrobium sp. TaxID=1871063 RepID=UPI00260DF356|nr:M1 family metallopeptidase [Aeromicrobium sp.]MCW2824057.1 pepN 2 [Aeromicrobium sp.]